MTSELMRSSAGVDASLPPAEQQRLRVNDGEIEFRKVTGDVMVADFRMTPWSGRISCRPDKAGRVRPRNRLH